MMKGIINIFWKGPPHIYLKSDPQQFCMPHPTMVILIQPASYTSWDHEMYFLQLSVAWPWKLLVPRGTKRKSESSLPKQLALYTTPSGMKVDHGLAVAAVEASEEQRLIQSNSIQSWRGHGGRALKLLCILFIRCFCSTTIFNFVRFKNNRA